MTKPATEAEAVQPALDYLKDPDEITRASFAAITAEADLGGLDDDLHDLAKRLVHACARPEIVADLAASRGAAAAGRAALAAGAPVLADVEMVARGIIAGRLAPGCRVICTLGDNGVAAAAARARTTRSAAAVDLWPPHLAGAVVAIGNAPTALFRLLELLADGAPRPALIIGLPVGFIGAAEAKQALIERAGGVPYVTLRGRFGGSALAAAAVNSLAGNGKSPP